MKNGTLKDMETMFLALSDGTRLRLLSLMGPDEVSVGYLSDSLGQSQPKVSRHLAYLRNAGLVSTRRDGKWIYYKIEMPKHAAAAKVFRSAMGWAGGDSRTMEFADPGETRTNGYEPEYADDYVHQEIEIHLL